MSDRFAAMDKAKADNECGPKNAEEMVFDVCGKCRQKVGLHCSDCKIQITGCLCTEVDRFGNDVAWQNAVERYGEEMARERYRDAGLFVPTVKHPDRLIIPGQN